VKALKDIAFRASVVLALAFALSASADAQRFISFGGR
jgi:hypothetical protein